MISSQTWAGECPGGVQSLFMACQCLTNDSRYACGRKSSLGYLHFLCHLACLLTASKLQRGWEQPAVTHWTRLTASPHKTQFIWPVFLCPSVFASNALLTRELPFLRPAALPHLHLLPSVTLWLPVLNEGLESVQETLIHKSKGWFA